MSKLECASELEYILESLDELQKQAEQLLTDHAPDWTSHAEAYGTLKFGRSGNPYDNTLETLIEALKREDKEEGGEA